MLDLDDRASIGGTSKGMIHKSGREHGQPVGAGCDVSEYADLVVPLGDIAMSGAVPRR